MLVGLFIVLSPGLLLTIPSMSLTDAGTKGVSSGAAGAADACADGDEAVENCKKATSLWMSGMTTTVSVIVHTLVFAVLLYFLPNFISSAGAYSQQAVVVLALLFAVLSPGVLLTLPSLSKADCGSGGKNVADGVNYCETISDADLTEALNPKCYKCTRLFNSGFTSLPAALVHGVVFGVVVYYVASNYF